MVLTKSQELFIAGQMEKRDAEREDSIGVDVAYEDDTSVLARKNKSAGLIIVYQQILKD